MPFKKQLEKPHRAQTGNMKALPRSSKVPYNMKELLQKYQDKLASIHHRNTWLKNINQANYINEYNRLKGIFTNSIVHKTGGPVHSRIQDLAKLANISRP